jgi:hypothetical protein
MRCADCGKKITGSHGVFCLKCRNKSRELTAEQYKEALLRYREYIANGGELSFFDCTDIGDKDTQCTWGLCDRRPEMWPDPQLHIWPLDFKEHGRSAPRHRSTGMHCPMDKDQSPESETYGCFYRCRVFQGPRPDRAEALRLYDLSLEKLNAPRIPIQEETPKTE